VAARLGRRAGCDRSDLAKLLEYNTRAPRHSCSAPGSSRSRAATRDRAYARRFRRARDFLDAHLRALPASRPRARRRDVRVLSRRRRRPTASLLQTARRRSGLGLAPGIAFGPRAKASCAGASPRASRARRRCRAAAAVPRALDAIRRRTRH
jgi:hypothetical protein